MGPVGKHPRPRVAVVGAGIAGLAAAAVLSRSFSVTVFERSTCAGGKIRRQTAGDQSIDCGPTVFTMSRVFEDVFSAAGANFHEYVTLSPLRTLARHFWSDGAQLDLYSDPDQTAEAIASFASQKDALAFRKFCARARRVFDTLRRPFLENAEATFPALLRGADPISLLALDPYRTLWRALAARFDDPRLVQLFARYATYCGSSPYKAPATLMLVAHVEQQGVFTVDGGMTALAEALTALIARNGGEVLLGADVARIDGDARGVRGVVLADGATFKADAVVANADVAAVAGGHLGADVSRAIRMPTNAERSQSAMTWTFAARAGGRDLSVHNVFFSDDYAAEFDAVFAKGRTPDAPTVYVYAPNRAAADTPGERAAGSAEPFFCLVNAPARGDGDDFSEEDEAACESAMRRQLERSGLRLLIDERTKTVTTPKDFARRFPGSRGALFGTANHGWRASFRRPGIRTRMPGLYLAGGTAHPGAGVPMAALSGKMAANLAIADLNSTSWSRRTAMLGGTSTP